MCHTHLCVYIYMYIHIMLCGVERDQNVENSNMKQVRPAQGSRFCFVRVLIIFLMLIQ